MYLVWLSLKDRRRIAIDAETYERAVQLTQLRTWPPGTCPLSGDNYDRINRPEVRRIEITKVGIEQQAAVAGAQRSEHRPPTTAATKPAIAVFFKLKRGQTIGVACDTPSQAARLALSRIVDGGVCCSSGDAFKRFGPDDVEHAWVQDAKYRAYNPSLRETLARELRKARQASVAGIHHMQEKFGDRLLFKPALSSEAA